MEIRNDIPAPAPRVAATGAHPRYPFRKMAVGESVFFPGADSEGREFSAARVLAAKRRKKGAPCRFVARKAEGGLRIWRVE